MRDEIINEFKYQLSLNDSIPEAMAATVERLHERIDWPEIVETIVVTLPG